MNSIRAAALMALALAACNLSNPGYDAPAGELAYPVAIALSDPSGASRAGYLYVANANFDLRYNGGSVQSYDLDALEDALREGECIAAEADPIEPDASAEPPLPDAGGADAGDADVSDVELDGGATDGDLPDADLDGQAEGDAGLPDAGVDARVAPVELGDPPELAEALPARPLLCDGKDKDTDRVKRCCFAPHLANPESSRFADLDPVRVNEIKTDSYATGIASSPDAKHVYVPLRAQSRLLHLDVDEGGRLSCGEQTGRCRRGPRYGREAEIDELELPATPTAVITGSFADLNLDARGERYFAATAHDNGQVSLFALGNGSGMPKYLYTGTAIQPISNRPVSPSSLRLDNGFLLVSAPVASSIARIGVRADVPANDERATAGVYLYRSAPINVAGLSFSSDIRDVQADERDRAAGESRRYYALLRGAGGAIIQSVGFLELDGTTEDGFFARAVDAVRVGVGMSKLVQANLGGRQLLFVSCYADGEIHVLDADRRRTVTVIRDVLGPFDMQVDVARRLLYVTDFRASVVRVIDLSGLARGSSGVPRAVATLGAPYTPGRVK